jgi:hypothetical protein
MFIISMASVVMENSLMNYMIRHMTEINYYEIFLTNINLLMYL